MARAGFSGVAFVLLLTMSGTAFAQRTPPLPTMPPPPSFDDSPPPSAKGGKAARKRGSAAASAAPSGSGGSFERPNKFVPAEFDQDRRGSGGGGAAPMMTGSGRPGMGMRF